MAPLTLPLAHSEDVDGLSEDTTITTTGTTSLAGHGRYPLPPLLLPLLPSMSSSSSSLSPPLPHRQRFSFPPSRLPTTAQTETPGSWPGPEPESGSTAMADLGTRPLVAPRQPTLSPSDHHNDNRHPPPDIHHQRKRPITQDEEEQEEKRKMWLGYASPWECFTLQGDETQKQRQETAQNAAPFMPAVALSHQLEPRLPSQLTEGCGGGGGGGVAEGSKSTYFLRSPPSSQNVAGLSFPSVPPIDTSTRPLSQRPQPSLQTPLEDNFPVPTIVTVPESTVFVPQGIPSHDPHYYQRPPMQLDDTSTPSSLRTLFGGSLYSPTPAEVSHTNTTRGPDPTPYPLSASPFITGLQGSAMPLEDSQLQPIVAPACTTVMEHASEIPASVLLPARDQNNNAQLRPLPAPQDPDVYALAMTVGTAPSISPTATVAAIPDEIGANSERSLAAYVPPTPASTRTSPTTPTSTMPPSFKSRNIRCHWTSCDCLFQSLSAFLKHYTDSHNIIECSRCDYRSPPSTSSPDLLIQHISVTHLNAVPCLWQDCPSVADDLATLTGHIIDMHLGSNKREYVCGWRTCERNGKPFHQKQKCMRHILKHTGHKPFRCGTCYRSFAEAAVLRSHERTHTGEKPFKCRYPSCPRVFSNLGGLTVHTRVHTGERPFKCHYPGCGRAFTESSNLTKHLRTHSGERPFRCPLQGCGKWFPRSDQAQRHFKVHLKGKARGNAGPVSDEIRKDASVIGTGIEAVGGGGMATVVTTTTDGCHEVVGHGSLMD